MLQWSSLDNFSFSLEFLYFLNIRQYEAFCLLAALGLDRCAWAFSSYNGSGVFSVLHCVGVSLLPSTGCGSVDSNSRGTPASAVVA